MSDLPDLCSFDWHDKDGFHRCMSLNRHEEHYCCCGATMHPAPSSQPKRKGRRRG